MPNIELKYSNDLDLDASAVLASIEKVIQSHDAAAANCKGLAYPAADFHHTHVILHVEILPQPHRDAVFMDALNTDLQAAIKAHLSAACFVTSNVTFTPPASLTSRFEP